MSGDTTRSTLYVPRMFFGSMVCLVFVVMGFVISFAASPFGLCFVGLGCIGLAAIFYWLVARPEFEHAPPGTLPDVPPDPVIREGRTSFSWIPYELIQDGTTTRMQVAKDPARIVLPVFSISVMMMIVGFFVYILWFTEQGQDVPLPFRILMVAIGVVAGATIPCVIMSVRARELGKLETLIIDRHERRLEFGDLELSSDQLVALQLCALARRAGPQREQTFDLFKPSDPALQWNLIWTNAPGRNPRPDSYHRQTLLLMSPDPRLGPFAAELAEALSVPLLNHATKEHWAREKRAARDRPLIKGSSI